MLNKLNKILKKIGCVIFRTTDVLENEALQRKQEKEIASLQAQVQEQGAKIEELEAKIAELERRKPLPNKENAPWYKLMGRTAELVKRIRMRVKDIQTSDEVSRRSPVPFLESLDVSMREGMVASGAEEIDNETNFNILRHEAVPTHTPVAEGAPIADTLEFGVCVQEHVFIRAQVEVKK